MRKQALDAIVTALTGLTTTGTKVFLGRVTALARNEVPGLIVRGSLERIETDAMRPRVQQRNFGVFVLVHVRETDDYEETLNQVFSEVEVALANASVAGGFGAKSITLRGISDPDRVQNEVTYVQAAMDFEVFYVTAEGAPEVAL